MSITARYIVGMLLLAAPCVFALWKAYPNPKFKRVMQDFGLVVTFTVYVVAASSLIRDGLTAPPPPAQSITTPAPAPAPASAAQKSKSLADAKAPYDLNTIGNFK